MSSGFAVEILYFDDGIKEFVSGKSTDMGFLSISTQRDG